MSVIHNLDKLCEVKFSGPSAVPVQEVRSSPDAATDRTAAPLAEVAVDSSGPPVRVTLQQLSECFGVDGYGASELSFDEELRRAVGMLRSVIERQAYKGVGDDGRTRRQPRDGEPNVWEVVDRHLAKAIYPDQYKPMVAEVRAIIDAYLE